VNVGGVNELKHAGLSATLEFAKGGFRTPFTNTSLAHPKVRQERGESALRRPIDWRKYLQIDNVRVHTMPALDFEGSNTWYASHGLHSYAAKCPPQLVKYALSYYSAKGDTVLDPMVGSGTTLVESRLLGRHSIGYDFDPLARLIAKVKSTPISDQKIGDGFADIFRRFENSDITATVPKFRNRDYWFDQCVLLDLTRLAETIASTAMEDDVRNFFWVAFSSLILSKTSVANARDIIHSRHHHWDHEHVPDVLARFKTRVAKMRRQIAEFSQCCAKIPNIKVRCEVGDARSLSLPDESVDLIFTSPPYATALDYTRAHFLVLPWMQRVLGVTFEEYLGRAGEYVGSEKGRFPKEISIDPALHQLSKCRAVLEQLALASVRLAKRIHRYFLQMELVLIQMARVLKPSRHAIVVVCPSHLRKIQVPTNEILTELANNTGLRLRREYTRSISERRRLLPYLKQSFGNRMDLEYILIFQKT
jgi:hypothetical protein